jgi:hypothetical protein
MEHHHRISMIVATVSTACLLAAACSSHSADRTVASLPGGAGRTSATGPPSAAQADQDFVEFARCMRAHGVAMSDPYHRPGHQGLSLALPPKDAATNAAYATCDHYIAPIEQAKASGAAAQANAAQLHAFTNYADCMRRHDIAMLDPTPQGQLNLGQVAGITSGFGRYSPQFRSADAACRHLLPANVHDDGTGP